MVRHQITVFLDLKIKLNISGNAIAVLDLEKPNDVEKFTNNYKPPPPISGTVEERCLQALGHIAAGLNCLQYFQEQDKDGKTKKEEEEEVTFI